MAKFIGGRELFMKTLTIASLIRNRDWILPFFLENLTNLDYDKKSIDLLFIVNDSTDNSLSILQNFKEKNQEYNKIQIKIYDRNIPSDERKFAVRNNYIYRHLALLRNYAMSLANTDKFLFIDSDILVPENLVKNLLSHDKEVISGLIWNGYDLYPKEPWKYPNIMKIKSSLNGKNYYEHISNFYV